MSRGEVQERVALAICRTWPKVPDGCAARCMDRLGGIPKEGCRYAKNVHGKMAHEIIAAFTPGNRLSGGLVVADLDLVKELTSAVDTLLKFSSIPKRWPVHYAGYLDLLVRAREQAAMIERRGASSG